MELYAGAGTRGLPSKRSSEEDGGPNQEHTQDALRELFQHVSNMPDSTKKKKLIRQVTQQQQQPLLLSHITYLEVGVRVQGGVKGCVPQAGTLL